MRSTRWITPFILLLFGGCACRPACAPAPTAISTTTNAYLFYNDGHDGWTGENYYGPDLEIYDVRDLDRLHGAVEVIFLRLPALARDHGATWTVLSGGVLRVAGAPQTEALVRGVIALLPAAPGPRA